MENSKENKFVCNFCHKIFTCGKSLGGHIRIHKNEKAPRVAEKQKERTSIVKLQVPIERRRSKRDLESEVANGNSGYGLRENPKITRRFADSVFTSRKEKFCRECGEGFQSSEALCYHLDCHSENKRDNKRLEYDYRIIHQKRDLIGNQSDERVQEAALSLMMMSKALRFSGLEGLNSVSESSDSKSSSRHLRESDTSTSNSNGRLEMKTHSEYGGENSNSGNFRKELCKKVKLKVSINGPFMDDEYKIPDVKFGVRIGRSSADILKNSMKTQKSYDKVPASSYKYELRKRLRNDLYSPDLWEGSSRKISNDYSIHSGIVRTQHHRESQTRMSNGYEWTHQSGENSVNITTNSISIPAREIIESSSGKNKSQQDTSGNEEKKLGPKRKHKCPICSKAFKSGQALGGHKRSHVVGSLEDSSIVTRQESNGVTGLIDLNVPAPMEEEESGRWG
ncbi:Zinc finger protein ZAT1, partial [Cucurbita argyrosperma subsp. sororia]